MLFVSVIKIDFLHGYEDIWTVKQFLFRSTRGVLHTGTGFIWSYYSVIVSICGKRKLLHSWLRHAAHL